jgi:hypothetical protein
MKAYVQVAPGGTREVPGWRTFVSPRVSEPRGKPGALNGEWNRESANKTGIGRAARTLKTGVLHESIPSPWCWSLSVIASWSGPLKRALERAIRNERAEIDHALRRLREPPKDV